MAPCCLVHVVYILLSCYAATANPVWESEPLQAHWGNCSIYRLNSVIVGFVQKNATDRCTTYLMSYLTPERVPQAVHASCPSDMMFNLDGCKCDPPSEVDPITCQTVSRVVRQDGLTSFRFIQILYRWSERYSDVQRELGGMARRFISKFG